jgi:23S rRNA (guanosine2251-2'-O)-methyltransferase
MTKRKRHGRPAEGAKSPVKSGFSSSSGRAFAAAERADARAKPRDSRGERGGERGVERPGLHGQPTGQQGKTQRGHWLYGLHAVKAALTNPRRRVGRLLLTDDAAAAFGANRSDIKQLYPQAPLESASKEAISQLLPAGAVHQGAAILVDALEEIALEDVLEGLAARDKAVILALDQVTDPQNVGAILRSAAAFDVAAVIVPDRHAPPETAAMAKAASGALEILPLVRVTNLARALEQLKQAGFWTAGLAGEAPQTLADADLSGKIALVLGAEGEGLRRLTRDHCDILVRLPISPRMESLNVSAAAAVALYELARGRT